MEPTAEEVLKVLHEIAPETVERAFLRVLNAKQAERIAELEAEHADDE